MEYAPHNLRQYSWTQTLLQHLQFEHFICLDQIVMANYMTNAYASKDEIPLPLVRSVQTNSFPKTSTNQVASYLECPNLISGVAASIISETQLRNQSAATFVTLVENQGLSMNSLYGLLSVWNTLLGINVEKQTLFALQKQKPLQNKLGGIYL